MLHGTSRFRGKLYVCLLREIKQDDFPIDSTNLDFKNLPSEVIEKKLGRHVWVRDLKPIYEMTFESPSLQAKQYIEALGSHIWVKLMTKQKLDLCRPPRWFPDELVTLIIDDEIDDEIDTSEIIALSDSRLTDLFGNRYCCKCINCDTRKRTLRHVYLAHSSRTSRHRLTRCPSDF